MNNDILRDQLTEKEKEVRLFQIKLREFKNGPRGLSLSDKQFLEMEAMMASKESGSVFQRLQQAKSSKEEGSWLSRQMDNIIGNVPLTAGQSLQFAPFGGASTSGSSPDASTRPSWKPPKH